VTGLKVLLRGILVLICMVLICAVVFVCLGHAQETPAPAPKDFQITGIVKSGKTALPGVTVTAANTLTGKKVSVATGVDGSFTIKGLARGRYVVKVEFMGFATVTQEVVLNPDNPSGKVDTELILASRQQEEQANQAASAIAASRGFQNLAVAGTLSGLEGAANGNGNGNGSVSASDLSSLPIGGAGADLSTESVSVAGTQGRSQDFGMGNEDEIQQRIQEFRERAQREGGAFGGLVGGQGGGPGGIGGPGGPIMIGRLGRGFNINQPHGFLYFQDDNAGLDARPYGLSGVESDKASYNQIRFGSFVGGPLKVPGLFDWSKTTFFAVGWNGTRGSTPYDAYSTVPTVPERNGNFSALTDKNGNAITIYDPQTGQPFADNAIDPSRFSAAASTLLNHIPLPTLDRATQNFHYVTSQESNMDALSLRLMHNFAGGGGPGGPIVFGPGGGGPVGGGGGGRNRRGPRNNLSVGFNWSRGTSQLVNPFPSLAGSSDTQGWNGNVRWTYGKGRVTNSAGFNYNHNRASTTNLYSGVTDVTGNAGITGISTDPFDWGLPGISFNTFSGFNGPVPSRELDQTYSLSDTVIWSRGKHNWRFGGDYRRISQGFRSARNAEGSFVFTGFATAEYLPGSTQAVSGTGSDFADFLLGLPQQTTLQSGTNSYEFRANSFDVYAQDDWRIFSSLSVNLGLRYEYNGPFTETDNRIANLAVSFNPASVTAFQVLAGQAGTNAGTFPASLVQPDRNNFAPRLGLAWRLKKQTVVRAGYGINYNLAQYGAFILNFAFQPPFAIADTNVSPYGSFLTLENGFPSNAQTTVTNNYALDPNYRLGQVQIWNVDIQRQLPGNVQLNVGYNGAKGTHLDTERALVPSCVATDSCQSSLGEASAPFIYESSEGNSILHAASVRVRKRMSKGLGLSASYVFSKSIDDASSIGGGGTVVAQNAFDLPAERGLSSFDQQHKFTGNWIYDLPFGDGRRFLTKGSISHVLGGWQWSGDFTIGSGFYFTPRVLGATADIVRGVSGSLRANAVAGQTVWLSNPTTAEWFNTSAFCAPSPTCAGASGSTYGDAGRNIILGPAQFTFNMSLNKTITLRETRALELRLQGNNIFNTPYFSSINTTVNSLTFGQVTGVGNMRRVTMVARFRF
jgi:hypothetical protein